MEEALGHLGDIREAVERAMSLEMDKEDASQATTWQLFAALGDVAGPPLAAVLRKALEIIAEQGEEIFLDILYRSQRVQGESVISFDGKRNDEDNFDRVYARNLGELFRVGLHIIMHNFGPIWSASGNASGGSVAPTIQRQSSARKRPRR
jgi:hypothetical protein